MYISVQCDPCVELVSLLAEAKPPATTLPCPGKPCTIISSLFLWHRLAFGYFPGLLGPVEMQPQKCIEIVQAFAAQATQVDGDSERLPPPSWQLNTSLSQPFYQKTQPLLWRMQNISGNVSSLCRGKQKSSSHNETDFIQLKRSNISNSIRRICTNESKLQMHSSLALN